MRDYATFFRKGQGLCFVLEVEANALSNLSISIASTISTDRLYDLYSRSGASLVFACKSSRFGRWPSATLFQKGGGFCLVLEIEADALSNWSISIA